MEKEQKNLIIAILVAVLFVILAAGKTVSESTPRGLVTLVGIDAAELGKYFENGQLKPEYLQQLNENIGQVPQFVMDSFGEGKTNVTLLTKDGQEKEFAVNVQENHLVGAVEGHVPDADAQIELNEETIQKIAQSSEPVEEIANSINSGEIKYKALSPKNALKEIFLGIISFFLKIIMAVFSFVKAVFGAK